MTLLVLRSEVEKILTQAKAAYPEECCGVLLGRSRGEKIVTEIRSLTNSTSEVRNRRYAIDPKELLALEKETAHKGLEVLGFYHSHPDAPADPSPHDLESAWPWYSYLILSLRGGQPGEMKAWVLRDDRSAFDEEKVRDMLMDG